MLDEKLKVQLVKAAIAGSKNSYSPYSKYRVGAALLTTGGEIFNSCNVEVASYGLTDCAESSLISKAVSEGMAVKHGRKFIQAIAVVTADGGVPCGRCRQRLREHCDDCLVISANLEGEVLKLTSLKELLPDSFGPENLGIK
ncbi:cytidine deaminase [Candidatus Beckwithbacteria bacterium CG22_combo_CG10-13_8_21_14_all_01_47_9]|nr:MAG: cytidine deaminase [Candidatus Beckwithbacteria bacterium CG23_combo_of_CG06-09_8_20_14_all_47_9]PIP87919.1 MAG: cytidine deaminase [Candidatus Beckwithbacteria bacterium CG22_combo_CG10-13_8_21_14_all_01_47_9]PJA22308.1 MAG: cytidine deaminase [Candidatus Beckwithbacteria bacterium CG_4_10_14_0_2_um_filter_47_25]PJC66236.1 MAG: cytidine deaminase [Candidatus Beckwithbacteria bacterium CG_4_9_14_0_2_um_filter_47_11]